VLARANRVTRPADLRAALRRGRRIGTTSAVLHVLDRSSDEPSRFGFVVSKSVGGAVVRNTVKRRLRAVSREVLAGMPPGRDVVIRALPGVDQAPWVTLHAEIVEAINRGVGTR
jgi:ribonuclease P protein component